MKQLALCVALCAVLSAPGCASRSKAVSADLEGEYAKAAGYWRSLAKKGDADAQYRLAEMYVIGQGVVRDLDQAGVWYRAAAEQEHDEARQKLGYLYLAGNLGTDQDPDAAKWLEYLAESGSVDIRYQVGKVYLAGEIVPRDTVRAIHWFASASDSIPGDNTIAPRLADDGLLREVAELGYDDAQFLLGKRYASGSGFPLSLTEAAKWYYLAGSQGNMLGQYRLGRAYGRGEGVSKDYAEALRWFGKAAEQNHAESQFRLGMLYMRGYGTKQDLVLAHKWFNLAATNGHTAAKQKRTEIAGTMSGSDLAEAERLAVEWKPQR